MKYCISEQSRAPSSKKQASVVIWDYGWSGLPQGDTSLLWHLFQMEDDLMYLLAGRTSLAGLNFHKQSGVREH